MTPATAAAGKNIKNAVGLMRPKYFDFKMVSLWAILAIIITVIVKIDSQNTLDTRFYYTGTEAAKYFKSLSERDVYRYLITEIFDIGFILTYTSLLFLSLKRLFFQNPKIKYLALAPAIFDLFETSSVILVLIEEINIKSYAWLGTVTALKWINILIVMLFFIYAGGRGIFKSNQS